MQNYLIFLLFRVFKSFDHILTEKNYFDDLNILKLVMFAHFINFYIKIRSESKQTKNKEKFRQIKAYLSKPYSCFQQIFWGNVLFRAFCCSLHCYFSAKFHRIFIFVNSSKILFFQTHKP